MLGALYGEWLLAWCVLGHRPRESLDDPKFIDGSSWMHGFVLLTIIGFLPVCLTAIIVNPLYMTNRQMTAGRAVLRVAMLILMWGGAFLIFRADPFHVLTWWFD